MRKIIKSLACMTAFIFLLAPLAFAASEYVDGWVGAWNVKMDDNSKVTWEITDTWVSPSGMSHVAYGVKNPDTDNIEFQIYYSTFAPKHNYIEASHDKTIYDLPQDQNEYTQLIPSDDFKSFTTSPGKYPIKSGSKGTGKPACVASYLLGADDPRLDQLRQFRDEKLAVSEAGKNTIKLYYDKSEDIIAVCEKNTAAKRSLKLMLEAIIRVLP